MATSPQATVGTIGEALLSKDARRFQLIRFFLAVETVLPILQRLTSHGALHRNHLGISEEDRLASVEVGAVRRYGHGP